MHLQDIIKTTKTLKLLYVEDDEISRLSAKELLANFFTDITTAVDGGEALEKFNENDFDIILSDINMPKLNGIDLMHEIRKLDKEVSIVFLTAENEDEYLAEGAKIGVDSFIIKPLGLNNLTTALTRVSEKILLKREKELNT